MAARLPQVSSKYNRGRQLLSKKAREVAKILRNIDEVPLRSELIQYERRFVELDELVRRAILLHSRSAEREREREREKVAESG